MFSKPKHHKIVVFLPTGDKARFSGQRVLLDVALDNDIDIPHSCGGMGSCGTCRVIVKVPQSGLSPRTILEEEMAADRGFANDERLSCQLLAEDGMQVLIPCLADDADNTDDNEA